MSGDMFRGTKLIDFFVPFRHGIQNPTGLGIVTRNVVHSFGLPTGQDAFNMLKPAPAAPAAKPKEPVKPDYSLVLEESNRGINPYSTLS